MERERTHRQDPRGRGEEGGCVFWGPPTSTPLPDDIQMNSATATRTKLVGIQTTITPRYAVLAPTVARANARMIRISRMETLYTARLTTSTTHSTI